MTNRQQQEQWIPISFSSGKRRTPRSLRPFRSENPNQVFSREELLKQVWGYDKSPTTRTVDTHILQLRQKTDSSLFETMPIGKSKPSFFSGRTLETSLGL